MSETNNSSPLINNGKILTKAAIARQDKILKEKNNPSFEEMWNFRLPRRKSVYLSIFYAANIDIGSAVN